MIPIFLSMADVSFLFFDRHRPPELLNSNKRRNGGKPETFLDVVGGLRRSRRNFCRARIVIADSGTLLSTKTGTVMDLLARPTLASGASSARCPVLLESRDQLLRRWLTCQGREVVADSLIQRPSALFGKSPAALDHPTIDRRRESHQHTSTAQPHFRVQPVPP